MVWLTESSTIWLEPLTTSLVIKKLNSYLDKAFDRIFASLLRLLIRIKLAEINNDPEKTPSLRGKVLWLEAIARGIPMHSFRVGKNYVDIYEAEVRGKKLVFSGLPRLASQSGTDLWIDDKARVKKILEQAGVPVPKGGSFSRFSSLLKNFHTLHKPVIIKPRRGTRGRHTTTWIYTEEELKKAFYRAKQLCHWVVMEEHLIGSVYRGTVIDGHLAGVLRGDPPRVTGDGIHTVLELIELKNNTRHARISPVVLSTTHHEFLKRSGHELTEILPVGETIDLLEKIGISYGGTSAEELHITHPDTQRFLARAGQAIDDPIVGFDFIIPDIRVSPQEQRWGIIECNGTPFINLHHYPVEGEPVNVAARVWDFVEKNIDQF